MIYFGISAPFSSLSLFTPSITAGLGYDGLKAQLMTVPPYAVAYVVQIAVAFSADRKSRKLRLPAPFHLSHHSWLTTCVQDFNARGLHSAVSATAGACGFLASALLPADAYSHRYGCLIVASAGLSPSLILLRWAMISTTGSLTLRRCFRLHTATSGLAVVKHLVDRIDWFGDRTQHWSWRRTWADSGHVDL